MKLNLSLLIVFGSGVLILNLSCKKFDTSQDSTELSTNANMEKFFNSHRTRDSKENAIVNYVKIKIRII